ncbi:MAG: hypothetical protein AABY75_04750 [Bacteroidota bacterium]
MEKHIALVGIFNIVYRSLVLFGALVLAGIGFFFDWLLGILQRVRAFDLDEVPVELFDIIPALLIIVAVIMAVVSIAGIIGGAAVLKRKEWGRILLLIISFLNLWRIPLGTVLGAYSIWVLFHDDTIRLFQPASVTPPSGT